MAPWPAGPWPGRGRAARMRRGGAGSGGPRSRCAVSTAVAVSTPGTPAAAFSAAGAQRFHLARPLARDRRGRTAPARRAPPGPRTMPGLDHVLARRRVPDGAQGGAHRLGQLCRPSLENPSFPINIAPARALMQRAGTRRPAGRDIWPGAGRCIRPANVAASARPGPCTRRGRNKRPAECRNSNDGVEQRRTQPLGKPPAGRAVGHARSRAPGGGRDVVVPAARDPTSTS